MKRLTYTILKQLVKEVIDENMKKPAPKQQYDARKYSLEEGEWEYTADDEWIRVRRSALLRLMSLCTPPSPDVLK